MYGIICHCRVIHRRKIISLYHQIPPFVSAGGGGVVVIQFLFGSLYFLQSNCFSIPIAPIVRHSLELLRSYKLKYLVIVPNLRKPLFLLFLFPCGVCLVVAPLQHFKYIKKSIQSTKREKLFSFFYWLLNQCGTH